MPTITPTPESARWHFIADALTERSRNALRDQNWRLSGDLHKAAQSARERARLAEVTASGRTITEWEWPNPIDGWNDPACPSCAAGPDSLTPIAEDSDIHICEECDKGAVVFTI